MELSGRSGNLKRLLHLSKEHQSLQIFVDDPPIILEPSHSNHTTVFSDPNLVQLFAKNYYDEYDHVSYHKLCKCMSLDGRFVYVFSYSNFIIIDLFSKKLNKITLCNEWPFTEDSDFEYWFLKVDDRDVFLYNNHAGSIYFMELDFISCSIQFKAHFRFDTTEKKVPYFAQFTRNVSKNRLVQINAQHFLILVRNDEDLPELELYSTNDLNKPLKTFKDIPNGESVHGCIKLNGSLIYVMNCDRYGPLKDLTIIDIGSGKRKHIPLNVKLLSTGTNFLIITTFPEFLSAIMSEAENGSVAMATKDLINGFEVHSHIDFDYYLNGKMLMMLYVSCFNSWKLPSVLIARLDIETETISRIVFDSPAIGNNKVFRSHFTFDQEGRLRLLNIRVETDNISVESTTVRGGGVDNLRQLSLLAVKCNHPEFLENTHYEFKA